LKRVIALSLKIYLDDCAYSKRLTAKLRTAGHDVLTPVEAGTLGLPDREHLLHAMGEGRVLLTRNCGDFEELHDQVGRHSGIAAVYQDNDSKRDMTDDEIVGALRNLEASGTHIESAFHILNAWRF
jgi:hypothetical protein